ncbi:hypothetical protein [Vibrio crassostreae]|uniref:Uncharacterized protein n=1 Tax=Vibrio crassostreae TaxID=246167 RepID=A0ABM9QZR5_9VIBR|nr:hypothetical protein [Vibrio crassostreae]TCL28285.1 hypothetical protein EDB52_10398 [Vibrio crassostreae]TCT50537.1 hypothetical protein EDB39_10398 [Vibrio crassostreae]TCT59613.1 hypothetical protein EDB40_10498 [Vibrio crassostreae]CAK2011149.1 conserved hypothetical protein [Vibrio crassostreae]CAK2057387.1 conserved hypothetical protein [Vibrio crassostreae]
MKNSIVLIILLIIAILVVFPLFIRIYVEYIPGEMIGSIDGWLGFLGGVSGGLMAFFSAYWIFFNDQKQRNKTWLYIQSEDTNESRLLQVRSSLIFEDDSKNTDFDVVRRMFVNKGMYPVAIIKFTNVSNNFAKNVSISISNKLNSHVSPNIHHQGQSGLITNDFVVDLPIQSSSCFIFHISPELIPSNDTVEFVVTSYNLQNEASVQNIILKINRATGAWDIIN